MVEQATMHSPPFDLAVTHTHALPTAGLTIRLSLYSAIIEYRHALCCFHFVLKRVFITEISWITVFGRKPTYFAWFADISLALLHVLYVLCKLASVTLRSCESFLKFHIIIIGRFAITNPIILSPLFLYVVRMWSPDDNSCVPMQSPFISMMNANYCNLEEQTLTLLLRSVRANCGLKVLKLVGNNLTGKGTFILSELRGRGEGKGRERI